MISVGKKGIVFLVLVSACVVMALVAVYYVYLSPSGFKARESADLSTIEEGRPEAYITLEGEPVSLRDFDSNVLVVNVWASWSPYTQSDHALLARIKSEYGDRITVRALNRSEQPETANAYLDSIGRFQELEYLIDTTDHLYATLGGYAMPETLFFDSIGNEVTRIRGTLNEDDVRQTLDSLLETE